jgi:hypothetical protein
MATLAFDTLRFARRLKEAGVPESQADVQAELMAEAFGFYADNLLTKDHFTEVLNARFAEQDAKFEKRFARQNELLRLHSFILGLILVAVVVPQLQAWLG